METPQGHLEYKPKFLSLENSMQVKKPFINRTAFSLLLSTISI